MTDSYYFRHLYSKHNLKYFSRTDTNPGTVIADVSITSPLNVEMLNMEIFMKKLIVSAALALAVTGVQAKDWKEIRFGTEPAYAPFEIKTPDGKLTGFDIDLGNAICAHLHAKCVWVENQFDGLIPALNAKKFDGIMSSMTVTEAREKQVAFSDKTYNTPTRLVAKKGSPLLPTDASLKGKRVGVLQGSIQEGFAKAHWAPKGVSVVAYPDQTLAYQDLIAGRVDATLQDAVEADAGFLKSPQGKDYAFAGPTVSDPKTLGVGAAIALRKGDTDLKQAINKALAEVIADGTYKKIEQKYFSFSIY